MALHVQFHERLLDRILQAVEGPLPSQRALAELTEERLDVANEEIGDFHGGEVAAPIELRSVRDAVARIKYGTDSGIGGKDRDTGRRPPPADPPGLPTQAPAAWP